MYLFSKKWIKGVFILPVFIIFFFYTLYPLVDTFITSFKSKTFYEDNGFIGLTNWSNVLHDEIFRKLLQNTVIVVVGELLLMLPLGMLLGFLLNARFKGNTFVKLATFIPYLLSGVMIAIIWMFLLDPGIGVINAGLNKIGLHSWALDWIGGVHLTPYSVVVVDTWKSIGFYGLLFFTGMKMLPKDAFEAAIIDGATRFQKTIYITIPLLKETIKICAVMVIIGAFNSFQTVLILTNGGPNNQSELLTSYLYKINFGQFDFGKGAVLSTILFIFVMLFSVLILAFSRKRVGD
ncbi:sugar ABC transporter permease [Paenibacillus psychroresistens]|uniref:Sugar ABC transporter permease n=1 Tax=Paenibacillus psychroresistens TaxID=1778678 RepID=A0A6B8RFC7_9BACL|nr:sugar ABC transporter permease [Paenibacillus psychroresistens]QGQ94275.1 sugar ABC transporter permease [Paenibacillus psychroresistens]